MHRSIRRRRGRDGIFPRNLPPVTTPGEDRQRIHGLDSTPWPFDVPEMAAVLPWAYELMDGGLRTAWAANEFKL